MKAYNNEACRVVKPKQNTGEWNLQNYRNDTELIEVSKQSKRNKVFKYEDWSLQCWNYRNYVGDVIKMKFARLYT